MDTISKREIIDRVAHKLDIKRTVVKRVVEKFLDEIVEQLCRDNRVEFRHFGVFKCKHRAARLGHNPRTLERVTVPSQRIVKFKVALHVKSRLAAAVQVKSATSGSGKVGPPRDGSRDGTTRAADGQQATPAKPTKV